MQSSFQILVDSDAFVGWFYEKDAHHKKTKQLFRKMKENRLKLITTNLVVGEVLTVLSNRKGQDLAKSFLELINKFPVIHVDEKMHQDTIFMFKNQSKKGTSFVDCSNVVVMKTMRIPQIFSFDKAYSRQFDVEMVE